MSKNSGTPPKPGAPDRSIEFSLTTPPLPTRSVLNEANETIGKIDDLLVTRDGKEPYAVLSIGGFLGLGTHLVVVRYDSLRFDPDNKIVLPGGTKEGLTMLPAFEYAKQ